MPVTTDRIWQGNPALEPFLVPIDDLHEDPANARRHGPRNIKDITASLARFGQQKIVVIDRNRVVRAGNGSLQAMRSLGWTHAAAVESDLSGVDLAAYGLADNRSAESAEWDDVALASILEAIRSEPDYPVEATGFDDTEIDELLRKVGDGLAGDVDGETVNDPAGEWQGMPECENEDQSPFRSLHVHFANADDLRRFAEMIGQDIPEKAPSIWFPARPIERLSGTPYVDEP